ncbi:helix-turn-helix domain-containing protein [Myxacorys almedinensis A]|uniref:Helix-turn-helix domain-containing protein n=2 Tax=Myxacorys TaxID=2056239 RepID=A0A8J7Z2U2_9CYAN|nr:helix-turn-helix domain-containing protein [Myxacorys almedinensis A]
MSKNRHDSQFMSLLQDKSKTPEDVAKALGVSPRAVYYWTSGNREPRLTIKQVQALCLLLDCSIHELPAYFGPNKNAEA